MLAQGEVGVTTLIGTSGPRIWADKKVRKHIALGPGEQQTKLDHFLEDGPLSEEEDADVQWDEEECQRTLGRVLRHDLLNKLTVAQGGLDLFDRSREDKFLDMARRNLEACGEIVTKMSSLENSSGTMQMTPIDVASVADRVMRGHQGRGVDLKVQGQGWTMADGALFHVLENLVSNAIRHAAPSNVRIDIVENNRKVLVKVADDGIGIPMEAREGLFQEGFKFGPKGNTGLGLFIVRRIVQRYGGSIWVEENVPNGTVFCVELRNVRK
jgi:signal transduction histidine kinase